MKFNPFLLLILILITSVHLNFLKNLAMRSKMQSLACSLFYQYNEVKKIDKSINEIAKENDKHNDVYIPPEQYKEIINEMKKYKEIGLQFLVFKMMYGDKLAAKIYMDIINENKEIEKDIDEKEVLDRVRKIVDLTNGIGASHHAKYLAHEYLKNYNPKNSNRCQVNFASSGLSFLEKRSKSKLKTKAWNQIKYYKTPLNADIRNKKRWLKKNETFPMVITYGETYPSSCGYKNPTNLKEVSRLDEIELHPDCYIQIIGKQSDKYQIIKKIPVIINNKQHDVKFWISENLIDYNCIGWAVGLQDFLEIRIYTNPKRDVKTLKDFNLYLRQYREALITAEKKLGDGIEDKEIWLRVIDKKKPEPSLIISLLKDENILDKRLVGLQDDISTLQIFEICNHNIDGAVIFYGQHGELTHGARYVKELNTWTSKLGSSYLVTHDLHLFDDGFHEKSLYGKPKFLYCTDTVRFDAPGAFKDKKDFS
jgi:hypothetical protein